MRNVFVFLEVFLQLQLRYVGEILYHYFSKLFQKSQYSTSAPSIGKCNGPIFAIGDGICDDQNNVPNCDYDGGDCCLSLDTIITALYCETCKCLDSNTPPDISSLK